MNPEAKILELFVNAVKPNAGLTPLVRLKVVASGFHQSLLQRMPTYGKFMNSPLVSGEPVSVAGKRLT